MRPDAIIKTLEDAGFEARYVGGCVRDTLLDRPIHDWDIASQALPEDVLRLFPHCVPTGIRHGTESVFSRIFFTVSSALAQNLSLILKIDISLTPSNAA